MTHPEPVEATVRLANPADLDAILAIEAAGWPSGDGMRAEAAKFASRIECRFVHVACGADGSVLGTFTAFRPKWAQRVRLDELISSCPNEIIAQNAVERWQRLVRDYGLSPDWHEATADGTLWNGMTHNPRGEVLFGVGLVVRPEHKRRGLARFLLQTVLAEAAAKGAQYFLGYGRLPMFHKFTEADVDSYLRMTQIDVRGVCPLDPQLRFHWSIGARPIRSTDSQYRYVAIPGSMREDPESSGYGFLVLTPLGASPFPLDRLSR